jgi:hypothetical protein
MSSLYDLDEPLPSKEELAAAQGEARELMRLWKRRVFYSLAAFFISCASVIPFSKGFFLHDHAEPFGRILVYLSMGLLIPLVICSTIAFNTWMYARNLRNLGTK